MEEGPHSPCLGGAEAWAPGGDGSQPVEGARQWPSSKGVDMEPLAWLAWLSPHAFVAICISRVVNLSEKSVF